MSRLFCLLPCFMLVGVGSPVAAAADVAPETLLSAESVFYLRFDGLAEHRRSYDKTVFAELIDEEFQPLIAAVKTMIFDAIGPQVLSEKLLQGVAPAELIKLQKAVKQLPHVLDLLKDRGFVVGLEVPKIQEQRFQVTVVFPGGVAKSQPAIPSRQFPVVLA